MRELIDLKFLNGLPVERDGEEEGEEEFEEEDQAPDTPTEISRAKQKQGNYGSSEKRDEGAIGSNEIEYQINPSEPPSARAANIVEQYVQEIPD